MKRNSRKNGNQAIQPVAGNQATPVRTKKTLPERVMPWANLVDTGIKIILGLAALYLLLAKYLP